jgi:hypothetical protein
MLMMVDFFSNPFLIFFFILVSFAAILTVSSIGYFIYFMLKTGKKQQQNTVIPINQSEKS